MRERYALRARWRATAAAVQASKNATDGPWWAVPDDLVGGWCVRTSPLPPSSGRGVTVGEFMREADARLCAAARSLHLRAALPAYLRDADTADLAVSEDGGLYFKHGLPEARA